MVQMIIAEMAEPFYAVRVRFYKKGSLAYIAHLDLVRTMTKAIARAKIPVRYSEGFNPHPRLSFATAMSIGLESECEFMDIRLEKTVDPAALLEALNQNLTEELAGTEAYIPVFKLNDIAYSSYVFRIRTEGASEALARLCEEALHRSPVTVFKRSKSGDKDTDISGSIKSVSARFEKDELVLDACLAADNAGFLNPEYLITYLKGTLGILSGDPLSQGYTIVRTGLYTSDMTPFR